MSRGQHPGVPTRDQNAPTWGPGRLEWSPAIQAPACGPEMDPKAIHQPAELTWARKTIQWSVKMSATCTVAACGPEMGPESDPPACWPDMGLEGDPPACGPDMGPKCNPPAFGPDMGPKGNPMVCEDVRNVLLHQPAGLTWSLKAINQSQIRQHHRGAQPGTGLCRRHQNGLGRLGVLRNLVHSLCSDRSCGRLDVEAK